VNHEESVETFKVANASQKVVHFPPQMIAEDFSYYLKERKGAFVFLGTKNIDKNYVFPLHNSKFNFEEKALLYGIQSYINVLNHKGSKL
jgi:metal-dependent amidase/aminoacylase/carboxypeptidase family protein